MIGISRVGTTITVELPIRFDHSCLQDFQKLLAESSERWMMDLSNVEYLDSAALGMLLVLRDTVGAGKVCLRGASGHVRHVLAIAKFERMFEIL